MASHANSTTAPAVQARLLPRRDARGRFVKLACRSADELLNEIAAEIDLQEAERAALPPAPLLPLPAPLPSLTAALSRRRAIFGAVTASGALAASAACAVGVPKTGEPAHTPDLGDGSDVRHGGADDRPALSGSVPNYPNHIGVVADLGRAIHLRRQLVQAAEHGAALLASLGMPRLVGPDHIHLDPAAIGDALDLTIAALDALDGDTDLEPYLAGYYNPLSDPTGEGEPSEEDEPSLGAPENHPGLWHIDMEGRYYTGRRHHPLGDQTHWSAGRDVEDDGDDRESEAGYDLPEGDTELDDDGLWRGEMDEADYEQNLGSPIGDGDQRRWAQGDSRDREDVNENGGGEYDPGWYERPIGPVRPDLYGSRLDDAMRAMARQAEAVRRRVKGPEVRRDPDEVVILRDGRAFWRGPYVTRDGVPVIGFAT